MTIANQYFQQLMKEQEVETQEKLQRIHQLMNSFYDTTEMDFMNTEEPLLVGIQKEKPNPSKGKKLSSLLGKPVYRIEESRELGRSYMDFMTCIIPFYVLSTGEVLVLEKSLSSILYEKDFRISKMQDDDGWANALPILQEINMVSEIMDTPYNDNEVSKMLKAYEEVKQKLQVLYGPKEDRKERDTSRKKEQQFYDFLKNL